MDIKSSQVETVRLTQSSEFPGSIEITEATQWYLSAIGATLKVTLEDAMNSFDATLSQTGNLWLKILIDGTVSDPVTTELVIFNRTDAERHDVVLANPRRYFGVENPEDGQLVLSLPDQKTLNEFFYILYGICKYSGINQVLIKVLNEPQVAALEFPQSIDKTRAA